MKVQAQKPDVLKLVLFFFNQCYLIFFFVSLVYGKHLLKLFSQIKTVDLMTISIQNVEGHSVMTVL